MPNPRSANRVLVCSGHASVHQTRRPWRPLIPALAETVGWRYVFMSLALGPAFGAWSMLQLRRLPEALHLASGHR